MLKHLLEDFKDLNLRPSRLADGDVIGNTYEYMIAKFASDGAKKVNLQGRHRFKDRKETV